jgi:hypothetical protein
LPEAVSIGAGSEKPSPPDLRDFAAVFPQCNCQRRPSLTCRLDSASDR